jgi:hypothetical protein
MTNTDSRFRCALTATLLTLCLSASAEGADSERGKLLYENHCLDCHESLVHMRDNHKIKSIDDLRAQVIRWAQDQKLEWGESEVSDVVDYLDARYYHYEPNSE